MLIVANLLPPDKRNAEKRLEKQEVCPKAERGVALHMRGNLLCGGFHVVDHVLLVGGDHL